LEDAIELRRRILSAFEAAELATSEEDRQAALTFIIVGAGPTGVEMAGAIAELAHKTLSEDSAHRFAFRPNFIIGWSTSRFAEFLRGSVPLGPCATEAHRG
jgi:hypothetical protein